MSIISPIFEIPVPYKISNSAILNGGATLFFTILIGKAFTSSMKWTGFGPLDKTFGLFFGLFKGYVISVCLFTIVNWFYPFNNWSIELNKSLQFLKPNRKTHKI